MCGCVDDLEFKFKTFTVSRRGLFDDFPKCRFKDKSYGPTGMIFHK